MKTTLYFDRRRKDRPYIKDEWVEEALKKPFHVVIQPDGRKRHYLFIPECNKYLRVIVLEGDIVHNAFLDRGFTPRKQ